MPVFLPLIIGLFTIATAQPIPDSVDAILGRIYPPQFPAQDFVVQNGSSDARAAIHAAIDEAHNAGGGRVVIQAGTYESSGPIHFKSDVHLHLEAGVTLRFGTNASDYLPAVLTKFEGTILYNYSPLIRGYQLTNVALTGDPGSVIDGQGVAGFSQWRNKQGPDQSALREMGNSTVPHYERVFGDGHFLRPVFVQFFGCTNVLVQGIKLVDSPFWCIHPVFCQNVIVQNVTVDSTHINNDGVDPDGSVDVLIQNNDITSGDDCVVIKSGRDADAWEMGQPTRNVIVRGNTCHGPGNGICIGSEMSGGVSNVIITNNTVLHSHLSAVDFKASTDRGSYIKNVVVDQLVVGTAKTCIQFTSNFDRFASRLFPTLFQNFTIRNTRCANVDWLISMQGTEEKPIQDITLENIAADQAANQSLFENTKNVVLSNVTANGKPVPAP